jgi:hypothetical protein
MGYWRWFFFGDGTSRPGILKFANLWLFFHALIGILLASAIPVRLDEASKTFLIPLAGIFVGLSFAWGGNAQALLQTTEIEEMTGKHSGGFASYVYTFQTAILVILATLIMWGFAGLDVFDKLWPTPFRPHSYFAVSATLYGLASIAMRECWHVVLGVQMLLLARRAIRERSGK